MQPLSAKTWLRGLTALLATMLLCLMAANFIIDPFGLFGSTFLDQEGAIGNIRFKKIEYLKEHNARYDAYIFGSSRAGVIPLETFAKHLPQKSFYNMSVPNSNIWDQLRHVHYFIDSGFPVDFIFLQYDIDSIYRYEKDKFLFHPHPEVIDKNLYLYLLKSLVIYPEGDWKNRLRQASGPRKLNIAMENGVFDMIYVEQKFKADPEGFIEAVEEFQSNPLRKNFFDRQLIARKKADLQRIKDLCRTNNITLIVATTPYNQIKMDGLNKQGYLAELAALAEVTDFWDFSGYNEVTTNNFNYYEESHYRPHVAQWMAARIFGKTDQHGPPADFGHKVTSVNIGRHLQKRQQEIAERDAQRFGP